MRRLEEEISFRALSICLPWSNLTHVNRGGEISWGSDPSSKSSRFQARSNVITLRSKVAFLEEHLLGILMPMQPVYAFVELPAAVRGHAQLSKSQPVHQRAICIGRYSIHTDEYIALFPSASHPHPSPNNPATLSSPASSP